MKTIRSESTWGRKRTAIAFGRTKITLSYGKGGMGRFGGGWNWAVGFRCSKSTLLVDLLVVEVSVRRKPKGERW